MWSGITQTHCGKCFFTSSVSVFNLTWYIIVKCKRYMPAGALNPFRPDPSRGHILQSQCFRQIISVPSLLLSAGSPSNAARESTARMEFLFRCELS